MKLVKCKLCDYTTTDGKSIGRHTHLAHSTPEQRGVLKRNTITKVCKLDSCKKSFQLERTVNSDGIEHIPKKERQYCSKGCANTKNKTKPNIINNVIRIHTKCLNCGGVIARTHVKKLGYCSNECLYDSKIKFLLDKAIAQNTFTGVISNPKTVRRYLIHHYGNKCSICGIQEWQGKDVPVVMDHIDGDSDNWAFTNLRIICRNCDGLLPTFAGRNVNKSKKISIRMKNQSIRIKSGRQKTRRVS
jgi:hypothetical protein